MESNLRDREYAEDFIRSIIMPGMPGAESLPAHCRKPKGPGRSYAAEFATVARGPAVEIGSARDDIVMSDLRVVAHQGSGAARCNQNAPKHGVYTREAIAKRRQFSELLRQSRALIAKMKSGAV